MIPNSRQGDEVSTFSPEFFDKFDFINDDSDFEIEIEDGQSFSEISVICSPKRQKSMKVEHRGPNLLNDREQNNGRYHAASDGSDNYEISMDNNNAPD